MKTKHKIAWVVAAFALAMVATGGYFYYCYTNKTGPFKQYALFSDKQKDGYVFIDTDDNLDSVCLKLKPIASEKGIKVFRELAADKERPLQIRTGRYHITPDKRIIDVYRLLNGHQQEPLMLTIPETRTMPRMAALISRKLMLDSATIAQALCDSAYCQKMGYTTQTIHALFVPNTYEVYWDMTLDDLMKRMQKEHAAFWNAERQRKAEVLGLTPIEVATIASIVDEETANVAEKPTVAGLYLNRLHLGMLLQADPTVKYALQDFSLRRILKKHLEVDSPYNTYKYIGLPPGPIKVPSIKGLDAVLNAVQHDYIYMCAKEDFSGTHPFAATLKEHLQNASRYQQALNARGIK